jgi:hypothetical protein
METQNTIPRKSSLKGLVAAGLMAFSGLAGLVNSASAQTNQANAIKTSGNVAYFIANESSSTAPNSYPELNHKTTFPYATTVSGFLDFYGQDNGYFGKTVVEKGLIENLNLRTHVEHINQPLSRVGAGLSYSIPGMPKGTFAKLAYLPYFVDDEAKQVDNRQIATFAVGATLPKNFSLLAFGEMNMAASEGPQWCYGEIELAKNFGRFSIGANLQLNGQGAGRATPEFVPRVSLRGKF